MRLPPAPDGVSHCYFIYCSWPPVYSLFHVLKFKCGKHYQHPPWIIFFCCCCLGEKEGAFFFLFPFNFLCIVECIKWSKASFRLTKFKNYFLCSDAFVWKFIPVCTRQETRMWSSAHTLGLWAEELRRCGRPEYFREKRRKTVKALLAHRAAGCPTVVRELRYGCRWLCSHPWLNSKHLQKSECALPFISETSNFIALPFFSPTFKIKSKTFLCNTGWLFPLIYCCVAFSPPLLPLGWSNFPSPKMTLVSSSYPTSKSKRRQLKGQMVPKKDLCRVHHFKDPLNLHLVFKSKLYIFMKKKQKTKKNLSLKQRPGCMLHPFTICKTNTATEIKLFFSWLRADIQKWL